MQGSYSLWIAKVSEGLCERTRARLTEDLYLTCLDWFTDAVPAEEARERIRRAIAEDDGDVDEGR